MLFPNLVPDAFVFGTLALAGIGIVAAVVILIATPKTPWRNK